MSTDLSYNLVTKSNHLIEASYRLNLDAMRLILSAISLCDGRKTIPDTITITAEQYGTTFDLSPKNAYNQLRQATTDLYEKDIKIYNEKTKKRKRMRWLSAITYHDGEGMVSLSFSNQIKCYLGELQGLYKSYRLVQVKGLTSVYTIRIFELLQQFQKMKKRSVELKWLREYLDMEEKYKEFKAFNRYVLKPAVAELNKKTNYTVTCEPIREGRFIKSVCFEFHEDEQIPLF